MEHKNTLKVLAVVALLIVSNVISWDAGRNGSAGALGNRSGVSQAAIPPGGVRGFVGTVESVSDAGLTVKTSASDPFVSKGLPVRTVLVNTKTVIERLIQKDNATIQKEQTAFLEKTRRMQGAQTSSSPTVPIVPPEPLIREKISLKDLKAGDNVFVAADEDITTAKQFVAVRIFLQPSVKLPATVSSSTVPKTQPK